jgi:hypothetical protein
MTTQQISRCLTVSAVLLGALACSAAAADAQTNIAAELRTRPVNIALVDASHLRNLQARVLLRGGPEAVATVLLNAQSATEQELIAALGRVQDLYARQVVTGRIVRSDVQRAGAPTGLSAADRAKARSILSSARARPASEVRGYGAVRWVRVRSSTLSRV